MGNRKEIRGAQDDRDFPDGNDAEWMKHTLAWRTDAKNVKIDYRPVHMFTMDDEASVIPPKKRVY